jgi:hypothetical protein
MLLLIFFKYLQISNWWLRISYLMKFNMKIYIYFLMPQYWVVIYFVVM